MANYVANDYVADGYVADLDTFGGITFDGLNKRIILSSTSVTAAEIWSRWVDWHASHPEWPLAFQLVGGIALGSGLFIPPYFFLQGDWRIRPMESSHNLTITGNLFVDGGGVPVVQTLGTYQVNVNYTVPVSAQGIATGGGLTPEQDILLSKIMQGVKTAIALSA